jgi:hypothetical protein
MCPQHVALAVQLHNDFGSRALIDTLHALGYSISYDELCRLLTSAALQEISKIRDSVYVPNGIIHVEAGGCLIHEGDYNIDINAETIDGKNTFHSMARVEFQQQSVHQIQELEFACIQHRRNKSLPASAEAEFLMQCKPFAKPHKCPEPPRCTNPVGKIASCKNDVPIAVHDLGGFHALCCFISAIGKLWGDGSLKDLLVDSDVYAGSTVDLMLAGKQFNHAVRGLMLAYEALSQLFICSFVKWCERKGHLQNIPDDLWQQLVSKQAILNAHDKQSSLDSVKE